MIKKAVFSGITGRRKIVFTISVGLCGLAIAFLCAAPGMAPNAVPKSMFPDILQEQFFFDIFGWISGCWLLSYIAALCDWPAMRRIGQWLGIILVSTSQIVLISIWQYITNFQDFYSAGMWVVPGMFQILILGLYLGFFTMPALCATGSRQLTGLGSLAILLPWLLGRNVIIDGSHILCGLFF